MKKIFLLISVTITLTTNAQWNGPTSGVLNTSNVVSITRTGVGLGTPPPMFTLSHDPGTGAYFPLHVTQSRVGIGTNNPLAGLHITTNFLMTRANATNVLQVNSVGLFRLTTDGFNNSARGFYLNDGTMDFLSITENLFLFKNQNQDLFKVDANGYAYARKMVVTLANPFPDYVFETNYKLMPLSDLATFIAKNKHLPNMPSAQQVADNNNQVELGEMQTKLLEKVEELTLYILQQQAQIDELKRILAEQQ
jgi:hypothetical protein